MNHNQRIREEDRQEGAAAILEKLLQLKFGTSAEERLHGASADQLELWSARILTADSLADVFAE